MGFIVRATPKSERAMLNFRMTTGYKERAGSIRQKLRNIDNDHDLYAYILPQRRDKKDEKKGMLKAPKYPKSKDKRKEKRREKRILKEKLEVERLKKELEAETLKKKLKLERMLLRKGKNKRKKNNA